MKVGMMRKPFTTTMGEEQPAHIENGEQQQGISFLEGMAVADSS